MTYQYLKLLHIVAVILFLGNITTGLFWMRFAVKTKDWKIINHSMRGVIQSDKIFTGPGILFIIAGGIIAAIYAHLPLLRTGWIFWSLVLFSISGIVFMWKVGPLQKEISRLTSSPENPPWPDFHKKYIAWERWGLLALLTPFGALIMMVLKIPK